MVGYSNVVYIIPHKFICRMLLLYDFFFFLIILLVGPMGTVLKALGKCGKKLENTTRKASGVTVNVWQHRKWDLYSLFYLEKKEIYLFHSQNGS